MYQNEKKDKPSECPEMSNLCGPGKTRNLHKLLEQAAESGMRIIFVDGGERDFGLSGAVPFARGLNSKVRSCKRERQDKSRCGHCICQGKPGKGMSMTEQPLIRIVQVQHATDRIKDIYGGEGGREAAAEILNCGTVCYPSKPGGNGDER